jgi:hypothetical protein
VRLAWWQSLIVERYETHGLADKTTAARDCLEQINAGMWQVFAYERERVVFIVGCSTQYGAGEVHVWAQDGNLLRAGRLFMRDVWAHSHYIALVGAFLDRRAERFAQRFGWYMVGTGDHGARYWMTTRVAS